MSFPFPTTRSLAHEIVLNVIDAAQKHTQNGRVGGVFTVFFFFFKNILKHPGSDEWHPELNIMQPSFED